MVHFTRCSSCILYIQIFRWQHHCCRITPFGNPGVNGYVLLTPAYRSLSRPSSPGSSKASAIDLYSLDHIILSAFFFRTPGAFYSSFPLQALAFGKLLLLLLHSCSFRSFLYNFKEHSPDRQEKETTSRKKHFVFFTYRVLTCSHKARIFYFVKKR